MTEYGIDAIFALYCFIEVNVLVGVALRPQVKARIVCQNKFYKCRKPVGGCSLDARIDETICFIKMF